MIAEYLKNSFGEMINREQTELSAIWIRNQRQKTYQLNDISEDAQFWMSYGKLVESKETFDFLKQNSENFIQMYKKIVSDNAQVAKENRTDLPQTTRAKIRAWYELCMYGLAKTSANKNYSDKRKEFLMKYPDRAPVLIEILET